MNKRIFTLAKKNFKEKFIGFFPNTNMPGLPKNHGLRVLVLLITYIVMGFFSVLISSVMVALVDYDIIKSADYFTYSAMLISLMILIFSTYEIISDFYNAKDTEILLSMPFKNDEIFLGKLIGNIASDVDYFIFFAIITIVYAINIPFSIVNIILGLISFVAVIVTAYCILSLILMIIMRFTNARKYGGVFKFIGYGLALAAFGIYYYFIFSTNDIDFDEKQVDLALGSLSGLTSNLERIFYPASLFGRVMGDGNLMAFAGLVAIGILSFILVKFVASKIYLDSIIEKETKGSRKKKKSKKKAYKSNSQTMAMARKEFNSIVKNPVFLYQSGIMVVMTVAIIMGLSKDFDIVTFEKELDPALREELPAIFLGAGLLIASFLFSNSMTSFTSLSREGKSFYLIQSLPLKPSSNFLGRFLGVYLINFISATILFAVLAIILKLSSIEGLALYLGMALGGVFSVFYSLYWGSKKIYTSWTKPTELNKSGLTGFIMFIVSIVINVVIYGLGFGIYKISSSITLALMEVIVGLAIASVIFYLFGIDRYKLGFFDVK